MQEKAKLIELFKHRGVLKTPTIVRALEKVDRRNFVPEELAKFAYEDGALSIGFGQSISQPYTVVFMLELLQAKPGDKILEIGYGSGWQTALLAELASPKGHIDAFEIVPELCEFGKKNLGKYPELAERATLHCQSAAKLIESKNKYDRIICAAEVKEVPNAWREQLKIGGRMIYPRGHSIFLEEKIAGEWRISEFHGFVFVPFVTNSRNGSPVYGNIPKKQE